MKILWLVNIVMPELAAHLGRSASVFGGWLTGALNAVRESGYELAVCTTEAKAEKCKRFEVNGVTYYICRQGSLQVMQADFSEILDRERPDVVHIYGTEFEQSWAMASVSKPERTLVSVQGLVSFYAEHVFGGVPEKIARDSVWHKMLRTLHKGGQSIELQRNSFERRTASEIKTLKRVRYVNGGTAWGVGCARLINPDVHILDCELILRDSFYDGRMWKLETCEKNTIFAIYTYPIKGFDMLLHALNWVVKKHPDTRVYVAGNRCLYRKYTGMKKWIMNHAPDYDWYVQGLIEQYGLKEHITFMGYLTEEQMHERLLKSNVFVSSSAIENHSTSLGEAMISGVPSIASVCGGMQEMIDHGVDGFLYPFNETYTLAYDICRIFEEPELAKQFSVRGHNHATKTYDREKNRRDLLKMYETIIDDLTE